MLPPELTVVVPCYNERGNVAVLVERLDQALAGLRWEVVFVDDDSPDGTAAEVRRLARSDARVRCLRRIGRRGLSSAVIEGMLSSSASWVAVMDGDLQHDEMRLPDLLQPLRERRADLVVGSRRVEGGNAVGLDGAWRRRLSIVGTGLAALLLPVQLADPMSGFFALPQPLFEQLAPRLNGRGFKILLDLVLSAPAPLRVLEVPVSFHARFSGQSKMDALVMAQFAGMLLDRLTGGRLPPRFVAFALVGGLGVLVDLLVLWVARRLGSDFASAQVAATLVAMVANFVLNNRLTYRDQRLRGAALWQGLGLFMGVCGLGAVANVGIARTLYADHSGWTPSSAAGAAIGVVWNYAVSATLVWRRR